MKRINVSFFDEVYEKLEERMQRVGDKSIAQSIRELVDLGLKIEEAATKNQGKESSNDALTSVINMLKNNLIWSLETRLLTRHIVEKTSATEADSSKNILETCKERATNYVKGLLGEDEE